MIDISDLLIPIEKNSEKGINSVCGKYLKYDHIYDQIKEFRREDDSRLSQGIWQIEPKKASWNDVIKTCSHALKTETKDLQIAVWLAEALAATEGFCGLNMGVLLLTELCEKFWDDVYPLIDWENRDVSARIAPFFFFSEKIQERILQIPLTLPTDGVSNAFALSDWIMTRHNMKVKNSTGISLKELKKSVMSTSVEFLEQIETDVNILATNIKKLDVLLEKLCTDESPSFRKIYDLLNDILHINAKNISDSKGQPKNEKKESVVDTQQNLNDLDDSKDPINSPQHEEKLSGATIDQAYEALNEITVFLEKQQPQSPVSILLKIANAIGKKTFQELLEINMQNGNSVMSTISELYKVLK